MSAGGLWWRVRWGEGRGWRRACLDLWVWADSVGDMCVHENSVLCLKILPQEVVHQRVQLSLLVLCYEHNLISGSWVRRDAKKEESVESVRRAGVSRASRRPGGQGVHLSGGCQFSGQRNSGWVMVFISVTPRKWLPVHMGTHLNCGSVSAARVSSLIVSPECKAAWEWSPGSLPHSSRRRTVRCVCHLLTLNDHRPSHLTVELDLGMAAT